jgi:hypothetical protein
MEESILGKKQCYRGICVPQSFDDFFPPTLHWVEPTVVTDTEPGKMYHTLFGPDKSTGLFSSYEQFLIHQSGSYFTDPEAIQRFQRIPLCTHPLATLQSQCEDIITVCNEFQDPAFLEKHRYIEYEWGSALNANPMFHLGYTGLLFLSPLYSFLFPLLLIIIPFFLLPLQGVRVTWPVYVETLQAFAQRHFVGHAASQCFRHCSMETGGYFLFTLFLFVYQSMIQLRTVFRTTDRLQTLRTRIGLIRDFASQCSAAFESFPVAIREESFPQGELQMNGLWKTVVADCDRLLHCDFSSQVAWQFQLFCDHKYQWMTALMYGVQMVHFCTWNQAIHNPVNSLIPVTIESEQSSEVHLYNLRYPFLDPEEAVGNDYVVAAAAPEDTKKINTQQRILTGINASGKTTYLKTVLLNQLLAQRIGRIATAADAADTADTTGPSMTHPFRHFGAFINVCDTSDRESLFQQEALRCKDMIECIQRDRSSSRLIIMDELFSSTNPQEAAKGCIALVRYLSTQPQVHLLLTTHLKPVCLFFKTHDDVRSPLLLKTAVDPTTGEPTYQIQRGICHLAFVKKVLHAMDFPKEVLQWWDDADEADETDDADGMVMVSP